MSTSRLATAAPWSPSRLQRERSAWATAVSGVVSVMAHSLVFVVLPRCATAPADVGVAELPQQIHTVSLAEVDATPERVDVPDRARGSAGPADGQPGAGRSDGATDADAQTNPAATSSDGSVDPARADAAGPLRSGVDPTRDHGQGAADAQSPGHASPGERVAGLSPVEPSRLPTPPSPGPADATDRRADRPAPKAPRDRADRPTPDVFKQYVHTDGANAPAAGLGDMISAHNATDPTRRPADASSTVGTTQQALDGRTTPRTPGTAHAVVDPATQRGDTPDVVGAAAGAPLPRADQRDPAERAVAAAAQGTTPRLPDPGAAARSAAAASPAQDGAPAVAARSGSDGAEALPVGPPTWAPTAFRLAPSVPSQAGRSARPASAARIAADGSTSAPRTVADDAVARLDPPAAALLDPQPAAATPPPPVEAPAPSAIDSLRASLGWGKRDDDRTVAPQASAGTVGAVASSLGGTAIVLPDDVTDGAAGVSAVATALGRYIGQIEALVIDRWNAMPVPAELVAMGARGTVVVELRIDRAGRVTDARIVQRSGYPLLDMQAREAIPTHFPRFPRELEQDELVERVTMRTRNAIPPRTAP